MRIETARTVLRDWRDEDLPAFAALNADPEVARWLGAPIDRDASAALAARIRSQLTSRGFGLWALELPGIAPFAGFVGLSVPAFEAPFGPCLEIAWRLARATWGHGYATEAARAVLAHAFGPLALVEVVSFTAEGNARSRAVMERIGMVRDPDGDFDHPRVPEGSPLRRHVLYRARAP